MDFLLTFSHRHLHTKLALFSVGALVCLAPSIFQPLKAEASLPPQPLQIAVVNDCANIFAQAFTENKSNIKICKGDNEKFYMLLQNQGASEIFVPASALDESKNIFIARKGNFTYTLDMNKRQFITVERRTMKLRPGFPTVPFSRTVTTVEKLTSLLLS